MYGGILEALYNFSQGLPKVELWKSEPFILKLKINAFLVFRFAEKFANGFFLDSDCKKSSDIVANFRMWDAEHN